MKHVFREIQVVTTDRPGHARQVARDAQVDLILAVGGDGTVSEVVSGILERDGQSGQPILGILAAGRGNDFRLSAGSGISAALLAHKLATETPAPVDAGRISVAGLDPPDSYFINVAGVDFEPEVLKTAESEFRRLPRARGYLAAMLTTLRSYENAPLELHIDHRTLLLRANSLLVANSGFFAQGGIWPSRPMASSAESCRPHSRSCRELYALLRERQNPDSVLRREPIAESA